MTSTAPIGWREHLADWITGGTLTTLRAEKSIAAQMVARGSTPGAKVPFPPEALDSAEAVLPWMQAWLAGFREQPTTKDLRLVETLAWDTLRRYRPSEGGEGKSS